MMTVILLLWRVLLLLVTLVGITRIISSGIGLYHESLLKDQDYAEVEKTLFWNPQSAKALYLSANRVVTTDEQYAIQLARKTYLIEPTNAQALLFLGELALKNGDTTQADQLTKQASILASANAQLQLKLAGYWGQQGKISNVVAAMSKALTAKPNLKTVLFPILLKIVQDSSLLAAIVPLAQIPPPWWDDFYVYAAERITKIDTLTKLFGLRASQSKVKVSSTERNATVARLMKDEQWSNAYLLWVNGLQANQIRALKYIFNGGFELPISSSGFDWHIDNTAGFIGVQDNTFGVREKAALHLIFDGREFQFAHVYQHLVLNPGKYRFVALAKTNELQSRGGLVWEIVCANKQAALAKTDKLVGTNDWQSLTMDATIPNVGCSGQVIRLRSVGDTVYDNRLEGEAWFDQVQLINIR